MISDHFFIKIIYCYVLLRLSPISTCVVLKSSYLTGLFNHNMKILYIKRILLLLD